MAREHSSSEIAEDRPLSDEERSLVRWMLEHGESHAPPFLPQLEQARGRQPLSVRLRER